MDRLLQILHKTFIRRRTFQVTTSRGPVFTSERVEEPAKISRVLASD
jgi:hypothetical protein